MASDPIQTVLDFWFTPEGSVEWGQDRKVWWMRDVAFDDEFAAALGDLHRQALAGELDHWGETPRGSVALVVLLDQAPRNFYRNDPAGVTYRSTRTLK